MSRPLPHDGGRPPAEGAASPPSAIAARAFAHLPVPPVYATLSQVTPALFIGGYLAAADGALISALGVTHIVKLFADDGTAAGSHRHPGVWYFVADAVDDPEYDIGALFRMANGFIDSALNAGGRVLVHCHAGVSRSATIVLAYLMTRHRLPLREALARLAAARPAVGPNPGFVAALKRWEGELGLA